MIFEIIGMIIIAYLLGSIPTGLWIGKYIYHKDIRKLGSGKYISQSCQIKHLSNIGI